MLGNVLGLVGLFCLPLGGQGSNQVITDQDTVEMAVEGLPSLAPAKLWEVVINGVLPLTDWDVRSSVALSVTNLADNRQEDKQNETTNQRKCNTRKCYTSKDVLLKGLERITLKGR